MFVRGLLLFALILTVARPTAAAPDLRVVDVEISGSLSAAFARAGVENASILSALAGRLFMWDLDLRSEIDAGDRVRLVYRTDAAGEIVIEAARYQSRRRATTYHAYRFNAPDDPFPSYWDAEGREVPRRLRGSPVRTYDQITALLKDRPTHKGLDFKTPVGTPVFAHRTGLVTRANWRRKGNGNCLEVRFDDGTVAKYLHLSAVKAQPGTRVKVGTLLALTGNTGRSTAPHLHYQLERGGRTIDPLDYHGTFRRTLPAKNAAWKQALANLQPHLQKGAVDRPPTDSRPHTGAAAATARTP